MPVCTYYTGSRGPLSDGSAYHSRGAFVASRAYSLGTRLRLTTAAGRSIVVTVRDRTAAGRRNLDLPSRTWLTLSGDRGYGRGVLRVRCQVMAKPKKRRRRKVTPA